MKNNKGSHGSEGSTTDNKGESQHNRQKGAPGVSNKGGGKHSKDNSEGTSSNTTKKHGNSI